MGLEDWPDAIGVAPHTKVMESVEVSKKLVEVVGIDLQCWWLQVIEASPDPDGNGAHGVEGDTGLLEQQGLAVGVILQGRKLLHAHDVGEQG